jgi:hypothetical protein
MCRRLSGINASSKKDFFPPLGKRGRFFAFYNMGNRAITSNTFPEYRHSSDQGGSHLVGVIRNANPVSLPADHHQDLQF